MEEFYRKLFRCSWDRRGPLCMRFTGALRFVFTFPGRTEGIMCTRVCALRNSDRKNSNMAVLYPKREQERYFEFKCSCDVSINELLWEVIRKHVQVKKKQTGRGINTNKKFSVCAIGVNDE